MNLMKNEAVGQKLQIETKKTSIERFTICYVIKKGYFNLVRYLLNLGKDPNERDSGNSCRTALIYCTFIKDEGWALSIAQNLLEFGAMLHLTDSNNLSPIHYCAAYGLDKLLDVFLRSLDFDISKICDDKGNNALHYALQNKRNSCTRLLIEKCCQSKIFGICDKNKFGVSPINLIQPFDQKTKCKKLKPIKTNDQSFFTTELIDLSESSCESIKHSESEDLYKYMDILFISKPIDTNKRRISDINNNKFSNNLDENIIKSNDCMKYLELRKDHLISYNKLFYKKEDLFKVNKL